MYLFVLRTLNREDFLLEVTEGYLPFWLGSKVLADHGKATISLQKKVLAPKVRLKYVEKSRNKTSCLSDACEWEKKSKYIDSIGFLTLVLF